MLYVDHPIHRPDYLGRYVREMPVSLERMRENALDWEHLPHLHASSFRDLRLIAASEQGWHVRVGLPPFSLGLTAEVELKLDAERTKWVVTTTSGFGRGSEVWSTAVGLSSRRIAVVVDFFSDLLPRPLWPVALGYFRRLYRKLYDEDEAMMCERQRQLDEIRARTPRQTERLGRLSDIEPRLPMPFSHRGQRYQLQRLSGALRANSLVCPHMLGPLETDPNSEGTLRCPWHGYAFDAASGRCTQGAPRLKLLPAPTITVDEHGWVLVGPSAGTHGEVAPVEHDESLPETDEAGSTQLGQG